MSQYEMAQKKEIMYCQIWKARRQSLLFTLTNYWISHLNGSQNIAVCNLSGNFDTSKELYVFFAYVICSKEISNPTISFRRLKSVRAVTSSQNR